MINLIAAVWLSVLASGLLGMAAADRK